MSSGDCTHKVAKETLYPAKVAGEKGQYSPLVCLLLFRRADTYPFCQAPQLHAKDCPVSMKFDGVITVKEAERRLAELHGESV